MRKIAYFLCVLCLHISCKKAPIIDEAVQYVETESIFAPRVFVNDVCAGKATVFISGPLNLPDFYQLFIAEDKPTNWKFHSNINTRTGPYETTITGLIPGKYYFFAAKSVKTSTDDIFLVSKLSIDAMVILNAQPPSISPIYQAENQEEFSLSPNGKMITYSVLEEQTGRQLWVKDLATSIIHQVSPPKGNSLPVNYSMPVWSPDGKKILFSQSGSNMGVSFYQLWYYDLENKSFKKITNPSTWSYGTELRHHCWIDNQTIGFVINGINQLEHGVWKQNINSELAERIFSIPYGINSIDWVSVNKLLIMYNYPDFSNKTRCSFFNIDTKAEEVIFDSDYRLEMGASLSPNQQKMLFLSIRSGGYDWWIYDLKTKVFQQPMSSCNEIKATNRHFEQTFKNEFRWLSDSQVAFPSYNFMYSLKFKTGLYSLTLP